MEAIGFVFSALLAVLAVVAVGVCLACVRRARRESEALRSESDLLRSEIQDLRDRRLLPHAARAGLEDAIAIALDIGQEQDAGHQYKTARMRQLIDVIGQVRSEPGRYDQEQPNRKIAQEQRRRRV